MFGEKEFLIRVFPVVCGKISVQFICGKSRVRQTASTGGGCRPAREKGMEDTVGSEQVDR